MCQSQIVQAANVLRQYFRSDIRTPEKLCSKLELTFLEHARLSNPMAEIVRMLVISLRQWEETKRHLEST